MQNKEIGIFLKLPVTVTFLVMIAVNALSVLLPINGVTPGEVSDSYPNLFAPAGVTFSIWGVIYALLAAHTLYQLGLFRGREKANEALLRRTAVAFSISSLLNTAWIFSWHYMVIPVSMILMALLLLSLIYIETAVNAKRLTLREKFFIRLPFSIYFGWITVATIANATTLLVSVGWDGFGLSESTWTVIMLAAGALIGITTALRFKDIAYVLALIWAYFGILLKHTTTFSSQYPNVITAATVCIVLFAGTILYTLIIRIRRQMPRHRSVGS